MDYTAKSSMVGRLALASGVACFATFAVGGSAWAQATSDQSSTATSEPAGVEAIVVTGSRIVRDGFQAPTPVTVIGTEQIEAAAPANLADYINQLPSLAGSSTPGNNQKSSSSGTAGLNTLSLRGLGSSRTLVLLDGKRVVGSTIEGIVDINNIPQQLVSRVEIVTGGASAVYGSDALSGVVNFILDKSYTGVKAAVSGGGTTYGDGRNWKASLTGGAPFADGRGHVLFSGGYARNDGILQMTRDWNLKGWKLINNPAYTPTNGQPNLIVRDRVGLSTASLGGIIVDTALRGVEFGPGGAPRVHNYGSLVSDPFHVGGDWQSTNIDYGMSLAARIKRQSVFGRISYDVTDNINVFATVSRGSNFVLNINAYQYDVGDITVHSGNPFIPPTVQAQMTALNIPSFTLGTMNADIPRIAQMNERTVTRYVVGAEGDFDAFDKSWDWNAYYQKGISRTDENIPTTLQSEFFLAIDAVKDPTTGAIVCRVTLTDPNSGCVPWNVMGVGVNSESALDYVLGLAHRNQRFTQDVAAASLTGEPFSSWAGPISLALGIEHRHEGVSGVSTPDDLAGNYFVGNFRPRFGSYSVLEGSAETIIPLIQDAPWAEAMDLNAAIRATDYSVSGYVTTWKVGLTYSPVDDIRFRATRSRDIRAPNLGDLFESGRKVRTSITDPFNGDQTIQGYVLRSGNLELKPEKADTLGIGVVFQPRFLDGFRASVDYYDIEINDAIGGLDTQATMDLCFLGNQAFCDAITRRVEHGVEVIELHQQPFNLITERISGIDFEADYTAPLDRFFPGMGGDIALRGLATHYLKKFSESGLQGREPVDTVGTLRSRGNGVPNWRYIAMLTYDNGPFNMNVTARGITSGAYDTAWIECTSGCPTSTPNHRTIDNNQVDGALYWDLTASYTFRETPASEIELFFNVKNIGNEDPAMVPAGWVGTDFNKGPFNPELYDMLGTVFRAGVRISL